jgi:hypothetical protein
VIRVGVVAGGELATDGLLGTRGRSLEDNGNGHSSATIAASACSKFLSRLLSSTAPCAYSVMFVTLAWLFPILVAFDLLQASYAPPIAKVVAAGAIRILSAWP